MKCNVTPINIFLDTDYIEFSPTFIGMVENQSIHIVNNSEDASFYQWVSQNLMNQDESQANISATYLQIEPSVMKMALIIFKFILLNAFSQVNFYQIL